MLVLSRTQLQGVVVGKSEDIEGLPKVTVVEIKQERVRLGFDVAADVFVHRWEAWECVQRENRLGKTP